MKSVIRLTQMKTTEGVIEYMRIRSKLKKLSRVSIWKSILLNLCYFGVGGVLHPKFIVAKNVLIKSNKGKVNVEDGHRVCLGFGEIGFVDHHNERFIWDINGEVVFKGDAAFSPGCKLVIMKTGKVVFGRDFSCNANTKIICNNHIAFGNDCMVSWECSILDTDFHKILDENRHQKNCDRPILIGNHVWICSDAMLLKGAVVPNDCVIGARSTVSSKLPKSNCVYKNNDVLKENITWSK